jgi:hypothetical protein
MSDDAIDRFPGVLEQLEAAILSVYDLNEDLLDLEIIDALDAVVRRYVAEEGNRTPPRRRLSGRADAVCEVVERVCQWMLGRGPLFVSAPQLEVPPVRVLSVADILLCLKQIRKSVHLWNREGGRQGYLTYVSGFMG